MSSIYIWPVTGMHCASCERFVGDTLKKLSGVVEVEVSLRKRKAGVRFERDAPEPDLSTINAELKLYGYFVGRTSSFSVCELPGTRPSVSRRFLEAFGVTILVGLFLRFVWLPVSHLIPAISTGQSLGALFALGLVASVSSCLAANGAFLLAYTATGRTTKKVLWIHAGRLAAFFIGGALLGLIGQAFQASGSFYGVLGLILGVGFAFVGLHLLDVTPSLAMFGLRLPLSVSRVGDRVLKSDSRFTPFLVGAVTFLLPCGFTQTAQALALASGSLVRGAFMLLAFALGTLPVLYAITRFGSAASFRSRFFRLAAGAMLFLFAFSQIDGGLTVLGSPVTLGSLAERIVSRALPVALAGEQIVSMRVAYGAFSPSSFTIKRGVPVRWEIDGIDITGCASSIVAPNIGLNRSLVKGMNVVEFTPANVGTIPFSCPMGMIRGSFQVVE